MKLEQSTTLAKMRHWSRRDRVLFPEKSVIRFLVSDGWWMTGQTILVNGGYTTT